LFQIAQEAVRNAVRHACPTCLRIGLIVDNGQLVLSVGDDGSGIKASADGSSGLGLRIMKHRASVIGATLSVGGSEPRGTLVICRLPLRAEVRP
jgi:signal transduction histidine kinase